MRFNLESFKSFQRLHKDVIYNLPKEQHGLIISMILNDAMLESIT